ncbi:PREDICTED: uncharacterized protein LOC105565227 [Vollenhovia emeryi]|uniref:uncharacterized protein LOC105565227 n=1 Tax=Vollenhovia emeryi TaxID=411798 RepID=UPI0005F4F182|nr:PREDICTED: uncharacterized protein LOC105565227 [Vollenhovia emeryi]
MKAIVIVLAISLVAVLGGLTDEQKAKLRQYRSDCVTETGIDPTVLENIRTKGEVPENDEKLACFGTCMLKKMGIMNADEEIEWELARSKLPADIPQEKFEAAYNACKDITGTGCEKGHNLLKCFRENTFSYFFNNSE